MNRNARKNVIYLKNMVVDYNNIAKKFSNSRKNLKWEELDYFFKRLANKESISILDIGCGN